MTHASDTYFTVTTRDKHYRETRRVECRDLSTAYTVAAVWRTRRYRSYRGETLPLLTTDIHLTEFVGTPGRGRVVACSTWKGATTLEAARCNAAAAVWRAIPADQPARGACIPMPDRRPPRMWHAGQEPAGMAHLYAV